MLSPFQMFASSWYLKNPEKPIKNIVTSRSCFTQSVSSFLRTIWIKWYRVRVAASWFWVSIEYVLLLPEGIWQCCFYMDLHDCIFCGTNWLRKMSFWFYYKSHFVVSNMSNILPRITGQLVLLLLLRSFVSTSTIVRNHYGTFLL